MSKSEITRQKLLDAAQRLFWHRGYSNVSVRDIARAAHVDAALVSRYFGGKKGLFEATVTDAFHWPELQAQGADIVELLLAKQLAGLGPAREPSVIKMMVMNASDPDVGALLRAKISQEFVAPVADMIGPPAGRERLSMIMAVLIGASVVRHDIRAGGMADCSDADFAAQLRHLVNAAIRFGT